MNSRRSRVALIALVALAIILLALTYLAIRSLLQQRNSADRPQPQIHPHFAEDRNGSEPETSSALPIAKSPYQGAQASESPSTEFVVQFVDRESHVPVEQAMFRVVKDPIAVKADDDPELNFGPSGSDGIVAVRGFGWGVASAPGYAAKCIYCATSNGSGPRVVELSRAALVSVKLLSTSSVPIKDVPIRISRDRRLSDGVAWETVDSTLPANAGEVFIGRTNQAGVAVFSGVPVGRVRLSVSSPDYVWASRLDSEFVVDGDRKDVVARMKRLLVGAVVVDGLPMGWQHEVSTAIPEHYSLFDRPADLGAMESDTGQLRRIRSRVIDIAESLGGSRLQATPCFVAVVGEGPDDATEADVLISSSNGASTKARTRLVAPSIWGPEFCERARLPKSMQSVPVLVRFWGTDSKSPVDPVPIEVAELAGNRIRMLVDAQTKATSLNFALPPGFYRIRPDIGRAGRWVAPMSFNQVDVSAISAPVEVDITLDRPISLVEFDVRDEFGRAVQQYGLQTRQRGYLFGSVSPIIAVDADRLEVGIGNIDDAGYESIPIHAVELQRGIVNRIRFDLRRSVQ